MVEALPEETRSTYLIRDRDGIYGAEFRRRVAGMGLHEVDSSSPSSRSRRSADSTTIRTSRSLTR